MQSPKDKVDMVAVNVAIDKVLAYEPPPKPEGEQKRAQRKDKQVSTVRETSDSYKADKR